MEPSTGLANVRGYSANREKQSFSIQEVENGFLVELNKFIPDCGTRYLRFVAKDFNEAIAIIKDGKS